MDLEKRCDKKIDCNDQSDELYCELKKLDHKRYKKANAPANQGDHDKLEIGLWFDILDIDEVNEPEVRSRWCRL